MPDPDYQPSEEAQNDMITWMFQYYNLDTVPWRESQLWNNPNFALFMQKAVQLDSDYRKYWTQSIYPMGQVAAQTPTPAVAPTGTPPAEAAPAKFGTPLPEFMDVNGRKVDVNYAEIGRIKSPAQQKAYDLEVLRRLLAGEKEPPKMQVGYITLYAPVPSADNLNPDAINTAFKNIYGINTDGSLYGTGTPLSPADLESKFGYDPLKGTLNKEGYAALAKDISYAAMTDWAQKNYGAINSRVDELLKQEAVKWGERRPTGISEIGRQLEQNTYKWQTEHPEEARARWAEQFPLTPEQQMAREDARIRGLEAQQPQPAPLAEFQPSTAKLLSETAGKLGIPEKGVANISLRYLENQQNPEFANLTFEERKTLTTAGLEVSGQMATPEDEAKKRLNLQTRQGQQWENLVNKARLRTARPERLVRL